MDEILFIGQFIGDIRPHNRGRNGSAVHLVIGGISGSRGVEGFVEGQPDFCGAGEGGRTQDDWRSIIEDYIEDGLRAVRGNVSRNCHHGTILRATVPNRQGRSGVVGCIGAGDVHGVLLPLNEYGVRVRGRRDTHVEGGGVAHNRRRVGGLLRERNTASGRTCEGREEVPRDGF